jgi:L-alanine-DL-glutamate epimerase-like enolase superfamily enzyme
VTVATLHLLAALPNAGPYLELSIEGADYYPWQTDLFLGDPFAVSAGTVAVPAGARLGRQINPRWLEKATYKKSAADSFQPSAYAALYHKGVHA